MGVEWQAVAAVATAMAAGITALMTIYTRRLAGETVALAADSREQVQLSRSPPRIPYERACLLLAL